MGESLFLEAPEPVRFESRVSVATLEIPQRRKTNLQESGVSEGERFESDKIQAYKEEGSFSRDSVILMCLPLVLKIYVRALAGPTKKIQREMGRRNEVRWTFKASAGGRTRS